MASVAVALASPAVGVPGRAAALGVQNTAPIDRAHLPTPPASAPWIEVRFKVDPTGCDPADTVQSSLFYGSAPGHQAQTDGDSASGTARLATALSSFAGVSDAYLWHVEVRCRAPSGEYLTAFSRDWTVFVDGADSCGDWFSQLLGDDLRLNGRLAYHTITVDGRPARVFDDPRVGDTIETGAHTRAELTFADGSVMRIGPATKLELTRNLCTPRERRVTALPTRGRIWMMMQHAAERHSYLFDWFFVHDTPGSGGGVRGSTAEISVDPRRHVVVEHIIAGHGWITSRATGSRHVPIAAGWCRRVRGGGPPSAQYRCSLGV